MYSTLNIPVSTNFITAVGPNGHIITSNILENISTYGVGYLPDVWSTIDGNILSVSKTYFQSEVNMSQLSIMTAAISSQISTTMANIYNFSTYTIHNFIPSTVSTVESTITGIYSKTNQAGNVNQTQYTSTNIGLSNYLSTQTSNAINTVYSTINSNLAYLSSAYVTISSFNTYSTILNNTFADIYGNLSNTGSEFDSLSTFTYYAFLFFQSTNTMLASNFDRLLQPSTQNPNTIFGYLSTTNNVVLPSNIEIQSINNVSHSTLGIRRGASPNYQLSILGDTHVGGGLISINEPTNGDNQISYDSLTITQNTSQNLLYLYNYNILLLRSESNDYTHAAYYQLEHPTCKVKTVIVGDTQDTAPAPRQCYTYIGPNAENLALSIASNGAVAINKKVEIPTIYSLDISGNLNFTGSITKNGVAYDTTSGLGDVLGVLSTTQNVFIYSTIFIQSMNTVTGNVGINCNAPTSILDVNGNVSASNTVNITGYLDILSSATNTFAISTLTNTNTFRLLSQTDNTILSCIPSTNNIVTVNCATTQSNYQLEVNGSIRATGAVMENKPLIWSYSYLASFNSAGSDLDYIVRFTTSNYETPGPSPLISMNNYNIKYTDYGGSNINQTILSNFSVFVTPYAGLYSISVNAAFGLARAEYRELILYDISANNPIYISHIRASYYLEDTKAPLKFSFLSNFPKNSKFSVIHHKEPNKGNNYSESLDYLLNVRYLGEG
jgi:hypothetical protein